MHVLRIGPRLCVGFTSPLGALVILQGLICLVVSLHTPNIQELRKMNISSKVSVESQFNKKKAIPNSVLPFSAKHIWDIILNENQPKQNENFQRNENSKRMQRTPLSIKSKGIQMDLRFPGPGKDFKLDQLADKKGQTDLKQINSVFMLNKQKPNQVKSVFRKEENNLAKQSNIDNIILNSLLRRQQTTKVFNKPPFLKSLKKLQDLNVRLLEVLKHQPSLHPMQLVSRNKPSKPKRKPYRLPGFPAAGLLKVPEPRKNMQLNLKSLPEIENESQRSKFVKVSKIPKGEERNLKGRNGIQVLSQKQKIKEPSLPRNVPNTMSLYPVSNRPVPPSIQENVAADKRPNDMAFQAPTGQKTEIIERESKFPKDVSINKQKGNNLQIPVTQTKADNSKRSRNANRNNKQLNTQEARKPNTSQTPTRRKFQPKVRNKISRHDPNQSASLKDIPESNSIKKHPLSNPPDVKPNLKSKHKRFRSIETGSITRLNSPNAKPILKPNSRDKAMKTTRKDTNYQTDGQHPARLSHQQVTIVQGKGKKNTRPERNSQVQQNRISESVKEYQSREPKTKTTSILTKDVKAFINGKAKPQKNLPDTSNKKHVQRVIQPIALNSMDLFGAAVTHKPSKGVTSNANPNKPTSKGNMPLKISHEQVTPSKSDKIIKNKIKLDLFADDQPSEQSNAWAKYNPKSKSSLDGNNPVNFPKPSMPISKVAGSSQVKVAIVSHLVSPKPSFKINTRSEIQRTKDNKIVNTNLIKRIPQSNRAKLKLPSSFHRSNIPSLQPWSQQTTTVIPPAWHQPENRQQYHYNPVKNLMTKPNKNAHQSIGHSQKKEQNMQYDNERQQNKQQYDHQSPNQPQYDQFLKKSEPNDRYSRSAISNQQAGQYPQSSYGTQGNDPNKQNGHPQQFNSYSQQDDPYSSYKHNAKHMQPETQGNNPLYESNKDDPTETWHNPLKLSEFYEANKIQRDNDEDNSDVSFQNHNYQNTNYQNTNYHNTNYQNTNYHNINYQSTNHQNNNHQNNNYQNNNHQNNNYQNSNYQNNNHQNNNYQNSNYQNSNYQNNNHQNNNYQNSNYQNNNHQNNNYQNNNYQNSNYQNNNYPYAKNQYNNYHQNDNDEDNNYQNSNHQPVNSYQQNHYHHNNDNNQNAYHQQSSYGQYQSNMPESWNTPGQVSQQGAYQNQQYNTRSYGQQHQFNTFTNQQMPSSWNTQSNQGVAADPSETHDPEGPEPPDMFDFDSDEKK